MGSGRVLTLPGHLLIFVARFLAPVSSMGRQVHRVIKQPVDAGLAVDDFVEKQMAGI